MYEPHPKQRDILMLEDEIQALHNKLAYVRPLSEELRQKYLRDIASKEEDLLLLNQSIHKSNFQST
jgi:hypothetical protein